MSINFDGNQFDYAFKPEVLSNWEVPKPLPIRPYQRRGNTKPICDEHGRFLSTTTRPNTSPFSNFKSTWELPDKISRYQANELNGLLKSSKINKKLYRLITPTDGKNEKSFVPCVCPKNPKSNITKQDDRSQSQPSCLKLKCCIPSTPEKDLTQSQPLVTCITSEERIAPPPPEIPKSLSPDNDCNKQEDSAQKQPVIPSPEQKVSAHPIPKKDPCDEPSDIKKQDSKQIQTIFPCPCSEQKASPPKPEKSKTPPTPADTNKQQDSQQMQPVFPCPCSSDKKPTTPPESEKPKTPPPDCGVPIDTLDLEYVPGAFTAEAQRHPSHAQLVQQKLVRDKGKEQKLQLNDLYLGEHKCTDPIALLDEKEQERREVIPHVLGEGVEDNFEKMRLNNQIPDKPSERSPSPLIPAYYNFQMAKKMAQENLEHQPLPDCIMDRAFRKLQAQGILNPGLALEVLPTASGIGIKTYKAGPTHCTKMKVFRPKTCGIVPKPVEGTNLHRPQTSYPGKEKLGSMDLAICWDYRPKNPLDEPKPPKHIDGSNGSTAPAVFTLVKTPRTPEHIETGRSGGVFTNTLGDQGFFDKDILRRKTGFTQKNKSDLKCTCGTSPISFASSKGNAFRSLSASREISSSDKRKRCKSSPNLSQIANVSEDSFKENNYRYMEQHITGKKKEHTCSKYGQKFKESKNHPRKTSRLCNRVEPQIYPEPMPKEVYKAAFKAGVPKSNSSGTITSFDSGCSTMSSSNTCSTKILHIPKPRDPYSKKNYNIDTLVPPFTCMKGGAGQGGYPEHWRLASVYQHAYKPIEQRRRPLLATVYK